MPGAKQKTQAGSMPERRSEPRIHCDNTPAELTIVYPGVTTVPCVVVNASKSGINVVSNTRTSPGQHVRIKMEQLIIFGEVRHCRAADGMFSTGVQISDVVGDRGLCSRLTEQQIDMLALGRSLPASERLYASYHLRHCKCCEQQLHATKEFFSQVRSPGK